MEDLFGPPNLTLFCHKSCLKSVALSLPSVTEVFLDGRSPKLMENCYFCLLEMPIGFGKQRNITYPNLLSEKRHVPHSDEIPVPVLNTLEDVHHEKKLSKTDIYEYDPNHEDTDAKMNKPQLFTQSELNDLVKDLDKSIKSANLHVSRIKTK